MGEIVPYINQKGRRKNMKPITKGDISAALKDVGVYVGQTLMVHTSLSKSNYSV
jgi:aminoglycoside N3'-acetyltransferase